MRTNGRDDLCVETLLSTTTFFTLFSTFIFFNNPSIASIFRRHYWIAVIVLQNGRLYSDLCLNLHERTIFISSINEPIRLKTTFLNIDCMSFAIINSSSEKSVATFFCMYVPNLFEQLVTVTKQFFVYLLDRSSSSIL